MPVLLPSPNVSFMSKWPSPLVSRSATTPPSAVPSTLERDVKVAIGSHHHMPRGAQAIGGHERAKAGGQGDAAIVGIAGRRSRRAR